MNAEIQTQITTVKDAILATVPAERIYLFGSYAYGVPTADSDLDFYVVLKDDATNPLLVLEEIYGKIADYPHQKSIDVLAQYRSKFDARSRLLTLERKVASEGVLLYG
jgi:predicted nucleotidyltransferase